MHHLTEYMRKPTDERAREFGGAEARAYDTAHECAELLLADAAIVAREVFHGASVVVFDIPDDSAPYVHRIENTAGEPLWTVDRAAALPPTDRCRKAADTVAVMCADARHYTVNVMTEVHSGTDAQRYHVELHTPEPREIILTPSRKPDQVDEWDCPMILRVHCRYTRRVERLGLIYIGPAGTCRREYRGPILPGPYAGLFAHCAVIDNYGGTGAESHRMRAAGLEFEARPGDRFTIGAVLFELRDDKPNSDYPQLIQVS
jgi:hypothetical protein